jgi:hypothetical protein
MEGSQEPFLPAWTCTSVHPPEPWRQGPLRVSDADSVTKDRVLTHFVVAVYIDIE